MNRTPSTTDEEIVATAEDRREFSGFFFTPHLDHRALNPAHGRRILHTRCGGLLFFQHLRVFRGKILFELFMLQKSDNRLFGFEVHERAVHHVHKISRGNGD